MSVSCEEQLDFASAFRKSIYALSEYVYSREIVESSFTCADLRHERTKGTGDTSLNDAHAIMKHNPARQ